MRRFMIAVVAVVFVAGVSYAQESTSAEQALIKLENELLDALLKRDVASIALHLADDFILGTPDGMSIDKDQALGAVESGAYVATSMTYDNLKVRVYGNTAVVSGLNTEKSQLLGTDTSGQYLFTDTWVKLDGRWQCVASHSSKVVEGREDGETGVAAGLTTEYGLLRRLEGNWAWQGDQVDIDVDSSPYGPGGKFAGSSTSHLILGGKYLLVKFQEKSPVGNLSRGLGIVGYNAEKKCYVVYDFMGDGSIAINTFTIEGRVAEGQIAITTYTGEKLLARHVTKYSPDWSTFEGTWQVSLDGGKTWSHWAKWTSKKSGGSSPPIVFE